MNANEIPQGEKVRAAIAGCFAVLGVENDRLRPIWNGVSREDRKFLLIMAREDKDKRVNLHALSGLDYELLSRDLRERIRAGLVKFSQWAEKIK